jgi:ABC-type transport system involved in cytochrome c biogenesis permease subunit
MPLSDARYHLARTWAVRLLRLESLILVAIAAYMVFRGVTDTVHDLGAYAGVIIFALLGAVGLFVASRGFQQGKAYGRAPAVLANGIAMGVSYFMVSGSFYVGAIPLFILGAITFTASLFGYRE